MRNKFKFYVFLSIFFLLSCLPKTEAAIEAVKDLPFSNPDILISMDFQDAGLKDILKIFSIQSGLNFVASDAVKDRKFTLYFDNVAIKDAMDKIFKANNLSYELDVESNIFIVNDLGVPGPQTITKVFFLKFASVGSSSIVTEKSNTATLSSFSGAGARGGAAGGTTTGITSVIEKLLSSDGKVVEEPRTNSLIVTDVPIRVQRIAEVIASLDVPQPQILLEVEMMDVSKDTTEKIGLKFGEAPLTLNTVLKGAIWGTKFPFGSPFGNRNYNYGTDLTSHPQFGSFEVNNTTASSYQILLNFIKTQSGTRYLARPRILTLNNETAEIKIATNEAIGLASTTTSSEGTSTSTSEAERAETGVLLRVTPQINMDTNEITMFVIPAVAEAATGGTFGATTFKDPELRYTKSMVRVKDGETIVIGGLIRRNSSETITRLPFLSDIPLIGKVFTHKNKDKDRERELLVFITPHIIKDATVQLAQAKKGVFPEREQSASVGILRRRQAAIDASLKSFENKKK